MKEDKSLSVMDRMAIAYAKMLAGTFSWDDRDLVDEMHREVRAGIMSKRDQDYVIDKAYGLAYGEKE